MVIAGLILLIAGGEALVRGASTLASKVGLPPLVIGLVVVSAATSAPELAVTVGSVLDGEPDLAVGNVVGSNIVNILVILGISAIISPLVIKRQLIRFDIPVMVGALAAVGAGEPGWQDKRLRWDVVTCRSYFPHNYEHVNRQANCHRAR